MKLNEIELTILVKGRPIAEYPHQGQIFVEGRAGSEYEIEVRNHTYQRVEAVLSVDGLSVLDGKPAGHESRGYLIASRGAIRIPGWLVDSLTVAKFAFAGKPQSYAEQSGNDTRNNGVIGAMVFREKIVPVTYPFPATSWNLGSISPTISRGIAPSTSNMMYGSLSSGTMSAGDLVGGGGPQMTHSYNAINQGVSPEVNVNANFVEQSLGTAFGESHQFATHTVSFQRSDCFATLLCYYDEKRGLKARGIQMPRREKPPMPQAFPAGQLGCQPPKNWHP